MATKETKSSVGYGKPPWIFRGSALYQLHLVKAETARAFIPKEFKLVQAFGYTLGGFFLASYDESPVGMFDELVVIAGIVWNPPTSCAWASKVLVNSEEACVHGRKDVGLPSQVARFTKKITAMPRQPESKSSQLLNKIGIGMDIQVAEVEGFAAADICTINIGATELNPKKWMGPVIKMSLPSFSGHTQWNPRLLKYSCQIECRIRAVQTAMVSGPSVGGSNQMAQQSSESSQSSISQERDRKENERNFSISVMLSKPILALEFNCLKMQIEAPVEISPSSEKWSG